MKLVVVESPSKIRKLKGFLGEGYQVAASFGHVRDLPNKDLGVSFDGGKVNVTYVSDGRGKKAIGELKRAAAGADEIILATDPDREGEAIAWHVAQALGRNHRFSRVTFNQITRPAVLDAMRKPRQIDQPMVDAQQARRVLDRLVGWMVSPVCWKHLGKGTSAGRVQSVAVRMVVERELEIRDFVPEVYHELWAWLWPDGIAPANYSPASASLKEVLDSLPPGPKGTFRAKLISVNGKEVARTIVESAWAIDLQQRLLVGDWQVASVSNKQRQRNPFPPFITSTLQAAASARLRWNPKRTMQVAQKLYEAGLITYMRTDSPAIAPEAVKAARSLIEERFGQEFLSASVRNFKAKGNAQEAHECIRPTDISKTPDAVSLESGEDKLYTLIWEQLVASQMAPALYDDTVAIIDCTADRTGPSPEQAAVRATFEAKGSVLRFPGWLALRGEEAEDEEDDSKLARRQSKKGIDPDDEESNRLPPLNAGDPLDLSRLDVRRTQTKPPPRFTQASLIKALEKEGVGRPSTYASIMETIVSRGYVEQVKQALHATPLGEHLVALLVRGFAGHFIETGFTRDAETSMDRVAEGTEDWHRLVIQFRDAIQKLLESAGSIPIDPEVRREGGPNARGNRSKALLQDGNGKPLALPAIPLDRPCPLCSNPLEQRSGKFGSYITCSNGKNKDRPDGCPYKSPVLTASQQKKVDAAGIQVCPKCRGPVAPKVARAKKTVFLSCLAYPNCDGSVPLAGQVGGAASGDSDGSEAPRRKLGGRKASPKRTATISGTDSDAATGNPDESMPYATSLDAPGEVPEIDFDALAPDAPAGFGSKRSGLKRTSSLRQGSGLKRTSSLKQGSGLKRTSSLKQGSGLKRGGPLRSKAPSNKSGPRFGPAESSGSRGLTKSAGEAPACPKCDSPMVLRKSARGPFYGCSTFPRCKGTLDAG